MAKFKPKRGAQGHRPVEGVLSTGRHSAHACILDNPSIEHRTFDSELHAAMPRCWRVAYLGPRVARRLGAQTGHGSTSGLGVQRLGDLYRT